jgi:hypothetical protein
MGGGGGDGSRRGRTEGAELEGENKRGGGVRGYLTALQVGGGGGAVQ